jgi:hypothetical protein
MTWTEAIIAVTIHLIVPLTGLAAFYFLTRKIRSDGIADPTLIISLFLMFATFGGLLLVALTRLFWFWSGMASLGTFYLILGAPFVMGVISYLNFKGRHESVYHLWTYRFGLLYFLITPAVFASFYLLER